MLRFFDSNCALGADELAPAGAPLDAASLLRVMDSAGIAESLVYSSVALSYMPSEGNKRIMRETAGVDRLVPCWVLLPESTRELPDGTVSAMLNAGVRAARMFPRAHRFSLSKWCCGTLLGDLASAQVPLFVDYGVGHWSDWAINYEEVHAVCSAHPTLPIILCGVGVADDRYLYPLMERLPNLLIELSYYCGERAIEEICDRFGVRRLLFGTAVPKFGPGGAVCQLNYAQISDEEKQAIAGDNLRRLLEGVRL